MAIPTVNTADAIITDEYVELGGSLYYPLGFDPIVETGVYVGKTSPPQTRQIIGSGIEDFSIQIPRNSYYPALNNVTPGTYYVRAYAIGYGGTAYGSTKEFEITAVSVDPTLPTIVISEPTVISDDEIQLDAEVTDQGGTNVTAKGFCWGFNINPTLDDFYSTDGTGLGVYDKELSTLDIPIGNYYVRAYATNSAGTVYSDQKEFSIGTEPDPEEPSYDSASSIDHYHFRAGFYDIDGIEHRVEIYTISGGYDEYEIENFDASCLDLTHGGSDKNEYDTTIIQGQELLCNFHIPTEDIDKIDCLFESTYKDYVIKYTIFKNPTYYPKGAVQFIGYVKPENMVKRYERNPPYIDIQISANDGLADLKETEFRNSDGELITGVHSLLSLIKMALTPIIIPTNGSIYGNDNGFKIQLNTYEADLMSSNECVLEKIKIHAERFFTISKQDEDTNEVDKGEEVMSCWDVIEGILRDFNCKFRLCTESPIWGKIFWFIRNPHELNSYEYEYNWSLIQQRRDATNNILNISEYNFSPYIEQQKIHPLKAVDVIFENRDSGEAVVGEGWDEWTTLWDITNFASYSVVTYPNGDEVLQVLITSSPGKTSNILSTKAFYVTKVTDLIEYLQVVMFIYKIGTYTTSGIYTPKLRYYIERPNGEKTPWRYMVFNPSGNYFDSRVGSHTSDFYVPETGYYKIVFQIVPSNVGTSYENWAVDWHQITVTFRNPSITKVTNPKSEDDGYDPFSINQRFYQSSENGGYEILEVNTILADGKASTEVGTFIDTTGVPSITSRWNSFGNIEQISILDLFSRNILDNRSAYKNFLRCTIIDREYTITLNHLLLIEGHVYGISMYSRHSRDGLLELTLVEILTLQQSYDPIVELHLKNATIYGAEEPPIESKGQYQTGHGFNVGDVIRYDYTLSLYVKAQANTVDNARALGIVTEVISDDLFEFISDGYIYNNVQAYETIKTVYGLEEGEYYFLDPNTPGALVGSDALAIGDIEQCVGFVTTKGFKVEIDARMIELPGSTTDMSVTGEGTSKSPVTLVNDETSPGSWKYYGTDVSGTKGFHSFDGLTGDTGPTGVGITGPTGLQGLTGDTGATGDSAFVYIAYASDASGTDFTMTFDPLLDYIAILSTDTEIVSPAVGDFAGLWKNLGGSGSEYLWYLHQKPVPPISEPTNVQINVNGSGSVVGSFPAGILQVWAINNNGATLPVNVPAFDVKDDTTSMVVSWDAVTGATGYILNGALMDEHWAVGGTSIDVYGGGPTGSALPVPAENTTGITGISIENEDLVDVVGSGINVELSEDELDSTKKIISLTKEQSDWDEENNESPNYIKGKPEIPQNTDEKIKYDVEDLSSGYLSEKVVGGLNIVIEEGSGPDENKMVIHAPFPDRISTAGSLTYWGLSGKSGLTASLVPGNTRIWWCQVSWALLDADENGQRIDGGIIDILIDYNSNIAKCYHAPVVFSSSVIQSMDIVLSANSGEFEIIDLELVVVFNTNSSGAFIVHSRYDLEGETV